eukprot:gene26408-biopygen16321
MNSCQEGVRDRGIELESKLSILRFARSAHSAERAKCL